MTFLRPWAFLILLVPLFIKGIRHFKNSQSPWEKFIDKKLLPTLLVKSKTDKRQRLWTGQTCLLWLLWSLALAGPALKKLPTPAVESAPNTVIVFDLSLQGNELLQGQAKLYDLLSALRGERVGLVVYGQKQGYTAMPLTPDIALIKEIVPSLIPQVLPEAATNPQAGLDYAAQLLDNAGAKGRILSVTNKPVEWIGRYPFGTLDLNKRTADSKDINTLLNQTKKANASTNETFSTIADVWADLGGWLVLLSLPFLALMFRKGILFLLIFTFALQSEAGFFRRPDQEIYQIEKQAIKAYQNKDYQSASSLFEQSGNLYNLGNALAFSGDIQGAIQAYTQELEQNPENQDAQFNKEYLEKQLPPPEQQQKQNEDGESEENEKESDEESDQNQSEKAPQSEQDQSEQTSSEQPQNQSETNKENNTEETQSEPTQDQTQAELEQALADYETENPYNQEEQQIINRLNHDPSRVLRYRLYLQHQKGQTK